jgi:hypothetical protein
MNTKRNDLQEMKRAREMTDGIEPCVQSVAYRMAVDRDWADRILDDDADSRERDERRGREDVPR